MEEIEIKKEYSSKKLIILAVLSLFSYFLFLPFILAFVFVTITKLFNIENYNIDLANILIQLLAALIVALVFFIKTKKDNTLKDILKNFFSKNTLIKSLKIFGLMYLVSFACSLVLTVLDLNQEIANQAGVESLVIDFPIITFFYVVLLGPIVEEIIFRFLLATPIGRKNKWAGIIISGLCFGLIHLALSIEEGTLLADLPGIISYCAIGILMGYAYLKENNLSVTMQAHIMNNFISYIAIMLL